MRKFFFVLSVVCLASGGFSDRLRAGTPSGDGKSALPASMDEMSAAFSRGKLELQVAVGNETSTQDTSSLRPNIDYGSAVIRLGYMLDPSHGSGLFRGNNEAMIEAVGGPIYTGPGNALGGLTLIYRRNFMFLGWRFVPYFDLGAGGVYSDAYHQKVQRALGSPFEFDLLGGVGFRYRLDPHWSIDSEFTFRHLSNANFASRNYGTNGFGGLLGFSYSF